MAEHVQYGTGGSGEDIYYWTALQAQATDETLYRLEVDSAGHVTIWKRASGGYWDGRRICSWDEPIADSIIQYGGTFSSGRWTKWKSGYCEIVFNKTKTVTFTTNGFGYGAVFDTFALPFTVYNTTAFPAVAGTGSPLSAKIDANKLFTTTSIPVWVFASGAGQKELTVNLKVCGTWK